MSTLNYSWTGRLQKSWSPFNTQRRNNRSLFTDHSIYIHLHLEHSTHIDRAVPPQRDEIFKNTNEFRPRVIGKGLADAEVEKRNEKISEDSKVGDPSYFISRWYVTPCRPSRRPLSNISVFTFDGLLSTSQPARLTRWKNKGKGRLADIYPSLWCAFSRREEEIIRGQVRGGIITLVIRERRCVWEKNEKN